MTPIADLVEQMIARAVAPDIIVAAVRAAELSGRSGGSPVDATAEKRRAYDRDRKAAKPKSTGNSTGIPPELGSALSVSIVDIQKDKPKKERARGNQLPPDWKPNAGHLAAGKQLGFNDAQISDQAEDMRLWARSNEHRAIARKSDWDLTFLTWLRRNKISGNGNAPRPGSKDDTRERTADAYRKLSDYVEAHADDENRGGGIIEANAGLLPFAKPA